MSLTRIDSGSGASLPEALDATKVATEPAMNSRLEIIYPLSIRLEEWTPTAYSRTRMARDATSASHIACRSPREPTRGQLPQRVCGRHKRTPGRKDWRKGPPNFRVTNRTQAD